MKVLIYTEAYKKDSAHLLLTLTEENITTRETKYKDVAGILGDNIKEAESWVRELNKSLVFIDENSKVGGTLLHLQDGKIEFKDLRSHTINDVNYDVWIDKGESFWNPVDFLLDEGNTINVDLDANLIYEGFNIINERLEEINDKLNDILGGFND